MSGKTGETASPATPDRTWKEPTREGGPEHTYRRNVETGAREVWVGYRWMAVEG